jgi:hypothetical protein
MSEQERIKQRTLALMQNKGYGWSRAMAIAAESVKREVVDATRNKSR